jgi:hypothetical protein
VTPVPLGAARTVTESELYYFYDLSSVTAIEDTANVRFGIFAYGGTGGTFRLDDITFTGNCITLGDTPTSTLTPTAVLPRSVIINEVAWMGTLASTSHEWIELYNPPGDGVGDINLANWTIQASDGSPSIVISSGTILDGGYFLLKSGNIFSADVTASSFQYSSGLLSDSGETLTLRDSSNTVVDTSNGNGGAWPAGTLTTAGNHGTMERMGVGAETDTFWVTNVNPASWNGHDIAGNPIHGTPGALNWGYGVTNTPTTMRTPTQTNTATLTRTPTQTNTPTLTPTLVSYKTVIITEVAWMGTLASSNDEWIELFNFTDEVIDMNGWQIRSFTSLYGTPKIITFSPTTCTTDYDNDNINDCLIAPGSYFLLERVRDDAVSDIPADLIFPSSFQLSNSGEMLILCSPYNIAADNCKPSTPNLYDKVIDVANIYDIGPNTPTPTGSTTNPWPAGSTSFYGTMERKNLISNQDTNWFTHGDNVNPRNGEDANGNRIDGTPRNSNWAFEVTATPRPTLTPTRTATPLAIPGPVLVLNEFLVRPGHDWNNDGKVDAGDEFIEVINAGIVDVNLGSYKLDVYRQNPDGTEIKTGIVLTTAMRPGESNILKPGEIRVFFASASGVYLRDSGDTVRLLKASNYTVVDAYTYPAAKSLDLSWCRYTDGYGSWVGRCFPTPNNPNSLTGSLFPPEPGGDATSVCLLPDSTPEEFALAECEQSGLDIWNPYYWDSFPGEWSEYWLWELFGKWLVSFQ